MQERRAIRPALTGRRLLIPAVAALVVAVDQVTKTWAENERVDRHVVGPLWFTLTANKGVAFSLGRGVTPIIVAGVVVLIVWLLAFSRRATRDDSMSAMAVVGLALLLGGAVGNLADRLFRHNRGAVIDFIDALRIGTHDWWPVFNVADAAVVVGVILLVVGASRRPARG